MKTCVQLHCYFSPSSEQFSVAIENDVASVGGATELFSYLIHVNLNELSHVFQCYLLENVY